MSFVRCHICPRRCIIAEGEVGFCRARVNEGGKLICHSYGCITSLALDPIEKKPLRRFMPGSHILSVGSFGCNMRCGYCQNYRISMCGKDEIDMIYLTPEDIMRKACDLKDYGNIGVAYTYNEPFVGFEYMYDCARMVHSSGMKNVIVTNGCVNEDIVKLILPYTDAMNIDVKGFTDGVYEQLGGSLDAVKKTVSMAAGQCHLELTTLIVPDLNDCEKSMESMSMWIASIDDSIPLHVSRFFPCYEMYGLSPTPVDTVYKMADVARKYLKFVYEGNV